MSLVVNTNIGSQIAQRSLYNAGTASNITMQRLSTGLRINSAADDSAGLSLSKKLSSQVSASDITRLNVETGVNMAQTAENDLAIVQENLQRMRDLAVQGANGVYASSERKMLDTEFQSRLSEIDRIAKSSKFSTLNLLDRDATGLVLQVGTNSEDEDRIDISAVFGDFQVTTTSRLSMLAGSGVNVTTQATARAMITTVSTAISAISTARSVLGSTINRLQGTISRIDIRKQSMSSALSGIQDTDIAKETAELTRTQILKQAATSMLQQVNQTPQLALALLQ